VRRYWRGSPLRQNSFLPENNTGSCGMTAMLGGWVTVGEVKQSDYDRDDIEHT